MADVSLIVEVKQKGVTEAVKGTKTLERNVKLLSDSLQKGSLSQRQYYKGVAELAQATNKTESELRKYATQIRATEKASKLAKEAARAEADAVKLYAQARRDATEANRRFDAEARKAVRTAKENATASRRLRMEFKEGYAAQVQLRAAQMRLNQARRQGIITDAEYKKQLGSLSIATQVAGRRMNSTGMAMQQTGYQVGDFLVQVQSGTNAMVAFGQQATQLVGILPMFNSFMGLSGTSLVALSAGLGIAIPLLTAIGAAFMRTRKDAEESSDSINTYTGALKAAREEIKKTQQDLAALRGGFADVLEYSLDAQIKSLENELNPIMGEYNTYLREQARLIQEVGDVTQSDLVEALTDAAIQYRNSTEEGRKLLELEKALAELRGQREQQEAAERLTRATAATLAYQIQMRTQLHESQIEGAKLAKELMDAWQSGQDLSTVNMADGVNAAAIVAGELAKQLGISLAAAQSIVALGPDTGASGPGAAINQMRDKFTEGLLTSSVVFQGSYNTSEQEDGGGGSSGGRGAGDNGVSAFMQQFLTDGEQLDIWREDQLAKLQEFNANELALLQAHGINKASIEEEYKNRVQAIKAMERTETLNNYASLFGALGSLMGSEGRKMLKVQAAISGAATMINAYEAASKAAAKAPDPITAASVWAGFVAKGIATVAKIKSLGSGGSPSGSAGGSISGGASTSSPSSQSMATPQAAPQAQRVLIKGLGPKDLLTGEMLQELFDKLYDENQERGAVFMVST